MDQQSSAHHRRPHPRARSPPLDQRRADDPLLPRRILGLAVVDDIGAIVIIAAVYSTGIDVRWIAVAAAAIAATVVARGIGVRSTSVFVGLGVALWLGLHEGGVHPTLAGVVMGLLAPSTPRLRSELIDVEELTNLSDADAARTTSRLAKGSVSVVEWLQHVLHPWTSYVIVPLFALANTGIRVTIEGLRQAAGSAVSWGVIAGLVIGKPLGIVLAIRIAAHMRLADEPDGATRRQIVGVGAAAGIGFTVALFITELALREPTQRADAKLGILAASTLAAGASIVALATGPRRSEP